MAHGSSLPGFRLLFDGSVRHSQSPVVAAALRTTLADAGQDGWGAAAPPPAHHIGTERLRLGLCGIELVWAPDGAYTRFISPIIGFLWVLVVSRVLLARSPATRAGW